MAGCAGRIADCEFSREAIEEAAESGRLLAMEVELGRGREQRPPSAYAAERSGQEEELSQREIREIILQGKDLGARRIAFVGVEAASHPDLLEAVRFVRSEGLAAELCSDGSGITAELARQLFQTGVGVVLKMAASNVRIEDVLAGKSDSCDPAQRAFQSLKDAGYPSPEAPLGVAAVICRENIEELAALWRWLRDQGVLPFFRLAMPRGDAKPGERPAVDPRGLEALFTEIAKIDREQYGREWDPQPPAPGSGCWRLKFSCRICWQGDVLACAGLNMPIGNIREQKLSDIIGDSEILEDLRDHTQTIKGPCCSCERADVCYGCRGAAYQSTGDYLASDPLCWRNADRGAEIVHLPFPVDGIIPQRSPMRVVDAVVRTGERSGEVEATVSADTPFAREDGTIEAVAYFEMMAQSIAALDGFKRLGRAESAAEGYLVGAQRLEILGTARVGDRLSILVHKSGRFGKFGTVKASVSRNRTELARGEIRVWHDGFASEGVVKAPES